MTHLVFVGLGAASLSESGVVHCQRCRCSYSTPEVVAHCRAYGECLACYRNALNGLIQTAMAAPADMSPPDALQRAINIGVLTGVLA